MIFSEMNTGTSSPKVHPPNGTRFYTFQVGIEFKYTDLPIFLFIVLLLSDVFCLQGELKEDILEAMEIHRQHVKCIDGSV